MKRKVPYHMNGLMVLISVSFYVAITLPFRPIAGAEPWRVEWEKTVMAASGEGRVTLYASAVYENVFQEFQKKYPDIKVNFVSGAGSSIGSRIMAERRAGRYLADIYIGGTGAGHDILHQAKALDPINPILRLPEIGDTSKWWQGRHHYIDPEGQYIFAFNGIVQSYFLYNTKLIDAKSFKSYWDFVHPKWKGKIGVYEPTRQAGAGGPLTFLYYHRTLGPKFLRRFLGEMDLVPTRDLRQLVDWLATGRVAISSFASADRANLYEAKKQGLPVNWFDPTSFKEGTIIFSSNGNVALMNKAPHPNASKIAVNWLLSREGQMIYQRFQGGADSLRVDIPKDGVPPHTRRGEGANFELMNKGRDMEPMWKLVEEVWQKGR